MHDRERGDQAGSKSGVTRVEALVVLLGLAVLALVILWALMGLPG